jgi:beta-galactosidase
MPTISYDGQSFSIDGRRVWLVSGAIHYPRVPHQLWRRRIRAAREAGLNCIETYCFWNAHEPQPGKFDFSGDLDLRRFVQVCGEEGMYVIVRPGPYICAEWDFGGMPAWLHRLYGDEPLKLRQAHPLFLEACARYMTAIMGQVRDLQITGSGQPERNTTNGNHFGHAAGGYLGGGGGPIIMMQAENEWFSHNEEQAEKYLRELVRYLRENGCEVPINNCNNLWQPIDGTISTWNGARNLATDMRQLAVVQPEAPRLVTEYWPGWFDMWGGAHATVDPDLHLYRTAGILATGSQYNLYMFHGGTNFAFWGGRTVATPGCFMTTSYDYDAPLLEAGGRGRKYEVTKRISTFASQFGNVFAHLSTEPPASIVAPTEEDHPLCVMHQSGSQGDVVFILRAEKDRTRQTQVLLPDGITLPIELGDERAVWLLLRANLGGVAELNYTNLRPWAFLEKKMLVLFGPAGGTGVIGLNDASFTVQIPTANDPVVERHDELIVVVLSTEQVDCAYPFAGGLAVNCAGLDDAGKPLPTPGTRPTIIIDTEGNVTRATGKPARKPTAPRITGWEHAPLTSLVDGTDEAYADIAGPESLERLGQDYGYGWYRLTGIKPAAGQLMAPQAADRVHLYTDGKLQKVLGMAPGAENGPTSAKLASTTVVLADNLGRFNYSQAMGEQKGLFGHLVNVKPAKLTKPRRVSERAADPFALSGWVSHRRKGDLPQSESFVWTIKPSGRQPMVLTVEGLPLRGTWVLNGEPMAIYLAGNSAHFARYVFTPGERGFTGGNNELKFSPLEGTDPKFDIVRHLTLHQVTATPTAKATWAFTPWTMPDGSAFGKLPRSLPLQPAWFRGSFTVSDKSVPLWFEPRGMSKGQLFLNGRNVGRYFVATHTKKAVPPQKLYYLPEPWLKTDGPNELLVFDEHGQSPTRSRLVYNAMGPYGK